MPDKILEIRDLDITFKTTAGPVHAIRGVNVDLERGETVAIVGESGSGKSVVMKTAIKNMRTRKDPHVVTSFSCIPE